MAPSTKMAIATLVLTATVGLLLCAIWLHLDAAAITQQRLMHDELLPLIGTDQPRLSDGPSASQQILRSTTDDWGEERHARMIAMGATLAERSSDAIGLTSLLGVLLAAVGLAATAVLARDITKAVARRGAKPPSSTHKPTKTTTREPAPRDRDNRREIDRVVSNVEEVAYLTNMLALSAAMEAAKADDQSGRFLKVVRQARWLGRRAARAARETTQLLGAEHPGHRASYLRGGETFPSPFATGPFAVGPLSDVDLDTSRRTNGHTSSRRF